MTEHVNIDGSCLCGAVEIEAKNVAPSIGACHCRMCRRWTSGPMQTVDCGTAVSIAGEENIGTYDSSQWAERGFCKQCGSTLFYRLKNNGQYFMAAGLFDNLDGFIFDHEVFVDEKPCFYDFAQDTRKMSGQEVFDYFANSTS